MWDFSLTKAMRAVTLTAPFILLRLVVYAGMAVLLMLMTGVGAGIGHMIGRMSHGHNGALWGGIAGFVLVIGLLRLAREYILYLVKAGHIAVLVELHDGNPVPRGEGQVRYGAQFVRTHFAQSSLLFGVDQIVKAVLRALTNMLNRLVIFLPIPGLQPLLRLAEAVVRMSLTYVDELILAYLIRTRASNPWGAARDGLILYAQNYRHFLKNALWLSVFLWLLTVLMFATFILPAWGFAAALPGHHAWWGIGFAIALALSLKAAVFEPLAIAALMQVFFHTIESQRPDPEWEEKLNRASARFRELGEKAAHWVPRPQPASPAVRPT